MCVSYTGDDGVPLSAVIKFVKLAYCYEQWDFFDNMIEPILYAIKVRYVCCEEELCMLEVNSLVLMPKNVTKYVPTIKHAKNYDIFYCQRHCRGPLLMS